jgi:hypothetical protein
VSNQKARDEGGPDENCRMRSACKATDDCMVDTDTDEFLERTLAHEGNAVREFYAALEGPVVVGIEATGSAVVFGTARRVGD